MSDRIVGKLGKLPAKRPKGLHALAFYQSNPLPVAPETVEVPKVEDWGMLGNDKYGDCTFAGVVHAKMANAISLGLQETFPTEQETVEAYLKFTNGKDGGAVEAELLSAWQNFGLFNGKIAAYAPTDKADFDELRSVIASYGLAYIGILLPEPAEEQFAKGEPWTLTNTPADVNILGGHCIILVGYNKDYVYGVTWGKIQPIAWTWLRSYMEESWAIITPEIVEKGSYGDLRLDTLIEDIKKL